MLLVLSLLIILASLVTAWRTNRYFGIALTLIVIVGLVCIGLALGDADTPIRCWRVPVV